MIGVPQENWLRCIFGGHFVPMSKAFVRHTVGARGSHVGISMRRGPSHMPQFTILGISPQ